MRIIERAVELSKMCVKEHLDGEAFNCELEAHRFVITGLMHGEQVLFTGTVGGRFLPPDGGDAIQFTSDYAGTDAQGRAVVTLPDNCYSVPGAFGIVITHTSGNHSTVIYAATGFIGIGETAEIVDPGNVINVDAIEAIIDDCISATASAQQAASFVNTIIAPTYSTGVSYSVGDYCTYEGAMYRCIAATGGMFDSSDWEQVLVGGEFNRVDNDVDDLQSTINQKPDIRDTTDTSSDLDIADPYGHVLARMQDGEIETKKFRGFTYRKYESDKVTYTGSACTLTVEHNFRAGDRIVLHVERGAKPWEYGGVVTYSIDDVDVFDEIRGDNAYMEYTLTEDAEEITASYGANATGVTNGDVMALEVYLLGDIPIRPTVIRVKQDGTGDYTTLRDALDSVGTNADDVIHPYVIEVYPGVYDVMDDYTQEEINAAAYTQTGFVGPRLYNGMTLVGVGNNTEIVINGELSTETYTSAVRKLVSTLNLQGSCGIKNLTVRATNLRYTVHDDFHSPDAKPAERIVENCIFEGYGAMTYTYPCTWGAGMSRGGTNMLFTDCMFNGEVGIHTQQSMIRNPTIRMVNCSMRRIAIGDLEESEDPNAITEFHFENCHIDEFSVSNWTAEVYSASHVKIFGHGGRPGALYNVPAFVYYNTVDTTDNRQHGANLSVGDAVMYGRPSDRAIGWVKATSYDRAKGVIVSTDSNINEYVVQISGLVSCERVGISGYQIGDYIGVSNGALTIVSDASEAIGRVVYVLTQRGFIEFNWRW